jgi:hypothetical protein
MEVFVRCNNVPYISEKSTSPFLGWSDKQWIYPHVHSKVPMWDFIALMM